MLDIGFPEFLLISFVLLIVVGPKDLPKVLRSITTFVRKIKTMASQFHSGIDDLANESEISELRKEVSKIENNSIIDSEANPLYRWVGGGCAEEAVRDAAMDSLKDGQTRIVPLDLDDEVLGVGMPCGGTMDVYVEPYLPRPELHLIGHGRIAEVLAELAHLMHFMVTVNDPAAVRERFPKADRLINSDPDFKQLEVGPNTFVVVVTQHKGDQHSIKKALEGNGPYIGLVASTKRSKLVFQYLLDEGVSKLSLIHI